MNDEIPKMHQDLRALAGAINHVLNTMYQGNPPEFLIVLAQRQEAAIQLHTITGIQHPPNIRRIGQHLIDMADAQERAASDPDNQVAGHA